MKHTSFTCIRCPTGCTLSVSWANGSADEECEVTGNLCKQGQEYAIEELRNPLRTVTTTVKVKKGIYPLVSVRTAAPIPKREIMGVLKELRKTVVEAPVELGQVVADSVAGVPVAVIATRNVPADVKEKDKGKTGSDM